MLKVLILILLAGVVLSLIGGAAFFFRDQGGTKRTLYMLGIRVTFAVLLLIAVTWGVLSGELTMNTPWYTQ